MKSRAALRMRCFWLNGNQGVLNSGKSCLIFHINSLSSSVYLNGSICMLESFNIDSEHWLLQVKDSEIYKQPNDQVKSSRPLAASTLFNLHLFFSCGKLDLSVFQLLREQC